MQEEIFGPVLVSMTFRTPAEAVELANNTRYGLAATRVDREHQPRARHRARSSRRGWSGSMPPTCSMPPPGSAACAKVGLRARRRVGRAAGLPQIRQRDPKALKPIAACPAPNDARSRGHRPHRQALHRRQAGPPGRRLLQGRSGRRRAGCWAMSALATARTSATRSRRPTRPRAGQGQQATPARRSSTTLPRTCRPGRRNSPPACAT